MEDPAKLIIGIFVIIAFFLAYFLRKIFPYLFCNLEKYEGQFYKGKSHRFFMIHFVISIGICIAIFLKINDILFIKAVLENSLLRIFSFIFTWILSFMFIGTIIEFYLTQTDKEYKTWKEKKGI